ncbi:uncharacterized protein LOC125040429 [Penaeus chinensis]|uniref:uncharacterized protein LOC125040429 n=1 Tax=Penaeus chinensis TaxID=139456 RepID=UPI001FB7485B|nr:uncharacterized protein LOC125040429 [Penaeus chinensis]
MRYAYTMVAGAPAGSPNLMVSLCLVVVVLADQSSHVSISIGGAPAVCHHSSPHHARPSRATLRETSLPLCWEKSTELSVEQPNTLEKETYLCPSETAYVRPLRAKNTEDKWRVIIVNNVVAHYQTLTQTTRIEECLTSADACPLMPDCYESKCLQKSIYHRFLVYDPYDQYFPFAIETFKLPASCACLLGAYTIDHLSPNH